MRAKWGNGWVAAGGGLLDTFSQGKVRKDKLGRLPGMAARKDQVRGANGVLGNSRRQHGP